MMKLDFDDWNIHVGTPHPFNERVKPIDARRMG
jgi:hypothetical protein